MYKYTMSVKFRNADTFTILSKINPSLTKTTNQQFLQFLWYTEKSEKIWSEDRGFYLWKSCIFTLLDHVSKLHGSNSNKLRFEC